MNEISRLRSRQSALHQSCPRLTAPSCANAIRGTQTRTSLSGAVIANEARKQPRPLRLQPESYAEMRTEILRRDGWRCQRCGAYSNCRFIISSSVVSPEKIDLKIWSHSVRYATQVFMSFEAFRCAVRLCMLSVTNHPVFDA